MPRTIELDDLIAAVADDLKTGKANAVPILTAIADHAYKGGLVMEKVSDWAFSHTGADAYRDIVKMVHEVLSKHTITMED